MPLHRRELDPESGPESEGVVPVHPPLPRRMFWLFVVGIAVGVFLLVQGAINYVAYTNFMDDCIQPLVEQGRDVSTARYLCGKEWR